MEPAPELRDLLLRFYEAMVSGDPAFFARHISGQPGVAFLGSDPDEWWTDHADLARVAAAQAADLRRAGATFAPGEVRAYREGSVGWAVDPDGRFRVGGREVRFRVTAVFRLEDEEWRIVHFHASVPVPNAEAVGQDLTT